MGFLDFFKPKWKHSNIIGFRIFIVLFLLILSILFILFVVGDPNYKLGELYEKCKAGNKKACVELARIAKNDKDWIMRETVVKLIADQTILIEIVKNDRRYEVRTTAVKNPNLTNQAFLVEIAKKDRNGMVRWAAVENPNLTDQAVLAEIAKNDEEWKAPREAAADKLNDRSLAQNVYADLFKNDKIEPSRRNLVRKITDQALLAEIAKNDEAEWVRAAAKDRLQELKKK